MNEAMNAGTEQTPAGDAFLEGLKDSESVETADQPETEESGVCDRTGTQPEETADTPAETQEGAEEAGDGPGGEPKEGQKETAPPAWSIKHMGAQRTITASEITPELLQKGLDYDRVRERYNETKPIVELFNQLAQKAGVSMTDYAKRIRTQAMRANGMSEAEAARAVELEERAVAAAQESDQRERAAVKARKEERIHTDVAEFAKVFPDVFERAKSDPKQIPQRVWDDVSGGMSLTAAYSRYAVTRAGEEVRAAREGSRVNGENHRNALRSTGSMRSAGSDGKSRDPFLDGFNG